MFLDRTSYGFLLGLRKGSDTCVILAEKEVEDAYEPCATRFAHARFLGSDTFPSRIAACQSEKSVPCCISGDRHTTPRSLIGVEFREPHLFGFKEHLDWLNTDCRFLGVTAH
jgi:hypothetical protein